MKRLIVCADGTYGTPQRANVTNVVKMSEAILVKDSKGVDQKVIYDRGVGTNVPWWKKGLQGAFGYGLEENVKECYRSLMDNYVPHENAGVYLFGYSRGAYTVRSLAGFIRSSGLLKLEHEDKFDEAWGLYRNRNVKPGDRQAVSFRRDYSRRVSISFLGVWDTVGAMGIPGIRLLIQRHAFHDVELSKWVKRGYQALAIDERRWSFKPSIWGPKVRDGKVVSWQPKPGQHVEQVWFAGGHSNVGGGASDAGLSDLTMGWMLDRAGQTGLEFDEEYLKDNVISNALGRIVDEKDRSIWKYSPLVAKRALGEVWPQTEHVHPAVLTRQTDAVPPYNPENLLDYQKKQ